MSALAPMCQKDDTATMANKRLLSYCYLVGGIGFLILAVILFFTSSPRDGLTLLTIAGIAVAGVLAIIAYWGTSHGAS